MSRVFVATYPGKCSGCGDRFPVGSNVKYDDEGNIHLVGSHVCNSGFEDNEDKPVLPRGRSVADRCPTCFIIPSSNGVCGC